MKKFGIFLTAIALFFIFSSFNQKAQAVEFLSGDSVTVPKDTVIDSSLFISGNSVTVDGEVNGDVFCAGKNVTITGQVHGDVICAGQTVTVDNVTEGNVRLAGQTVDLKGTVGVNATVLAQTVTVSDQGSITGELVVAADTLNMHGWVGRDIQGSTSTTTIDGQVDRNVSMDTDSLTVGDNAVISGTVNYTSDQNGSIAKSASISGSVVHTTPTPEPKAVAQTNNNPFQTFKNLSSSMFLFTTVLLGILLAFLFPAGLFPLVASMRENWLMTAVRGLVVIVVAPLALLLLAVTLIGIPAAILVGMGLVAAYFVGRVFCAILVGQIILESLYKTKSTALGWVLCTGVFVLWATFTIPILGSVASFFITIFGFGGVTYVFSRKSSKK